MRVGGGSRPVGVRNRIGDVSIAGSDGAVSGSPANAGGSGPGVGRCEDTGGGIVGPFVRLTTCGPYPLGT